MRKKLKLFYRVCPICEKKEFSKFFMKKNFEKIDSKNNIYKIDKFYVKCNNCNLVYTNPTVKTSVFDKIYEETIVGSFKDLKKKRFNL